MVILFLCFHKQVWEALKILDAADIDHPEISSDVIEVYTQRAVSKQLAGKSEGWNREHLWPRSYGLQKGPAHTDLHNIRPADVNVNSARGNKYYGECTPTSARCLRPAAREAASDTEADNEKWAPPIQERGDIARSLMYMAVCYGFSEPDGIPDLQLSNTPSSRRHVMGLLSTLLIWNELDPPSTSEKLRNERVCNRYQHNRNPFVDHPEYANLIWGRFSPSY
ncbi:Extracellular ribonuclease [Rhynchospora pubera]|uniref:Extracellular ribonuclease n=1 Tax=Rhynchospora pubera TaxID=906938 RepID=A0AAV8HSI1_9POAL|nr:Extracellular ribonuclease [Rhynchospora pubera]